MPSFPDPPTTARLPAAPEVTAAMATLADILDPTGQTTTRIGSSALAPRRTDLSGVRLGLLENTKHNAALLLDELAAMLQSEHGASTTVLRRTKTAFALPLPEAALDELVAECDVVLTGVGDCGSCSASAVADGIALERAGVPAAVICSDAFTATASGMAEVQGAPDYAYLTTAHPVAILDADAVRERARQLLPQVVATVTAAAPQKVAS
ncbi:UGSC family (seleno)protein [Geodermatophilus sp. CPCC 206100]|uniref:UGSC family (seleno)protein n=1 Tax=Geodermatophilus sp. CPCC 206100 TaxID=3020054 RepID=UPI003B00BA8F